jgi:hypothetical protein
MNTRSKEASGKVEQTLVYYKTNVKAYQATSGSRRTFCYTET